MSRLTRDGMVEPVSGDQILRRERGQRKKHFPCSVQPTTGRIGNHTRLIHTLLKVLTLHNYIDTYIHIYIDRLCIDTYMIHTYILLQ